MESIAPQSGSVTFAPNPRKLKEDAARIAGTDTHGKVYDHGLDGSGEDMNKQDTAVLTSQGTGNLHIQGSLDGYCGASYGYGRKKAP